MKKLIYLFVITTTSIFLTSCQFTEEITLKSDGSGSYKLNMNMSAMMQTMNGMKPKDSIAKEPEKTDTLFFIKDILEKNKDSIAKLSAEQRANLNAIKDLKMHVKIDEEKGIMFYDFILDFKNLSDLDNIRNKIEKAQNLQENKGDKKSSIENHKIAYSYTKNSFSRKVIMKDLTSEEQESYDKNLEESKMFMGGSLYKLVYHFPDKIKKINYQEAKFSDDRKTLTIEVSMDSLMKNPKLLDLRVDF
jgi:hypothetical protein